MMGMNAATGRAVSGADHIRQSLADILSTPVGTRVMRRDYGSLIPELIDQPLNSASLLRLYSATVTAIAQWEPRIKITGVTRQVGSDGKAYIDIEGIIKESGQAGTFNVPVGGA